MKSQTDRQEVEVDMDQKRFVILSQTNNIGKRKIISHSGSLTRKLLAWSILSSFRCAYDETSVEHQRSHPSLLDWKEIAYMPIGGYILCWKEYFYS